MNSAVCTLFEGHYHFGVATLSNSLYKNGFRGTIYVGYRGSLPTWALKGKRAAIGKWEEATVLSYIDGIKLIFLPLQTKYSLTNYKPDFMLELWDGPAVNADALYYFDPDIVVIDLWTSFEYWVDCGVALCEDINSPLQEFHPLRVGWREYYKKRNIELKFKNQIYVNGGFIGLLNRDANFLTLWKLIQEHMGEAIGGLENSIFLNQTYNSSILKMEGYQIFAKSDQDALNATIEAYNGKISFFGKVAMGFDSGHINMFHALGSTKPWKTNILSKSLKGRLPRNVDVAYWDNSGEPFLAHSKREIELKKVSIKIAKIIGRFYKI